MVAAPLLLAASQSFALYCGSDTNSNHVNAGRATLMYSTIVYTNGSNEYIGLSGDTTMLQETSSGYFQKTTSCSTSGDDDDEDGAGGQIVTKVGNYSDSNTTNRLDPLYEFSGKNYNLIVTGSDLVKDIGNDQQADALDLPRAVTVNIPEGATVEAAWVNYYGSAYLIDSNGQDTTVDTVSGSELGFDYEADIADNEINITIGNNDLGALTPSSASIGPMSRSMNTAWKFQSPYGTLAYSRISIYNNRLDLTEQFQGLSGDIPVQITRLQRADFAGKADSSRSYDKPAGPNDNGEWANDCLGNASFSVMVIYSLPTGDHKTISIYDGMSWAWNNDFATSKATYPAAGRLALDISIDHAAVDSSEDVNVYIGAIDGDEYGHGDVTQCESSSFAHETGHDYTWTRSGNGNIYYYQDIYEGLSAPEVGTAFPNYPEVTTVSNGLNFNIVKMNIQGVTDEATNTLIHVEGASDTSTTIPQEAMLIGFVALEAKTKAQPEEPIEPTNTAPVVTMNGAAEMTLTVGDTFTDPGATATDAEDGTLTPVPNCNVSTAAAGTYTCTYTATDSGDLTDTATRTVIVEDNTQPTNTAPEISLNGAASITIEFGATWSDPGATATDAEDGTITPAVNCPVNTQAAGTYTCTYTATDSGNLSASVTRTVTVEEEVVEPDCVEYSGTYSQLISMGVAYESWYSVYATGSDEYLGSSFMGGSATLIETSDGVFETGNCP